MRLLKFVIILHALCCLECVVAHEELQINDVWISEAPPVAKVHAAYLAIHNGTERDTVLRKIESKDYERVEIHESVVSDGQARMKAHPQLIIPANSTMKFEPGGYHLMLINPVRRMRAGDKSGFVFYLDDNEVIEIDALVKKLDSVKMHHEHRH